MKNKKRILILFLFLSIILTLTGCRGKEVSKEKITHKYHERFESVEIKNGLDERVYADFNIILLDEDKEILYKVVLEKELLKPGGQYYNLEEITPEYISYEKIASMDVEFVKVHEISIIPTLLIIIVLIVAVKIYFDR